ncbi:MAG: hypothetical protein OEM27_06950 [Nitrospinota bacterium]|nr:hypothetical protein [Nitrospinota bacterium]
MRKSFQIEKAEYGSKMIVVGKWNDAHLHYLLDHKIYELELNTAKGWKISNTKFLKDLNFLKGITIVGIGDPVKEVSGIHYLSKLKLLNIQTYCNTKIDFSSFPKLEICVLEWKPKSESLFECANLKRLWVNSLKKKDTEDFLSLVNLEWLSFGNGPVGNLKGLRNLSKLKHLELFRLRKLSSLDGIEKLKNLKRLEIHTCKYFKTINKLKSLTNLRVLWLINCGGIESLKPLSKLHNLKEYLMYESTNILDGDLTPISKIGNQRRFPPVFITKS